MWRYLRDGGDEAVMVVAIAYPGVDSPAAVSSSVRQHSQINPLSTQVKERSFERGPFTQSPSPPGFPGHLWNG
ncbi:hypothetical protein E2C01_035192 [Portunus trituberculatus]|uniref:Uncharacterized protein n=1 Tax=Portunus trituberculatus TaxID=210409 RepID=A0A5B7F521_PORTR|nr:hypothetical protein [Portunus trituberculatus]